MEMERSKNDKNTPLFDPYFEGQNEPSKQGDSGKDSEASPEAGRSKTSLRMVYEAQSQVIQSQIGDLELVRMKLGLSARKMCQLLMVDPSAWNRWTRRGSSAPPHIWRALQWYMTLQEKLPGLTPQYFIERVVTRGESQALDKVEELNQNLEVRLSEQLNLLRHQEKQIQTLKRGLFGLLVAVLIMGGLLVSKF